MSGQKVTFTADDVQVGDKVSFGGNEAQSFGPPNQVTAKPEDFMAQGPQGSATGRFFGGAWDVLNPVALAQGLYGAVRHPIDTAGNVLSAQVQQGQQAYNLAGQGRYSEAFGHGLAAAVPLIGPAAAEAGEQIGSGDIAGGVGKGLGLLAPVAAPSAVRGVVRVAGRVAPEGVRAGVAGALERGAARRVEDVMSPTVGPNKLRFGNKAAEVAPAVAKTLADEGAPMSRQGLHVQMRAKLEEAGRALDEAADARLASQQVKTGPIVKQIDAEIQKLTAEPVADASMWPTQTTPNGVMDVPIGEAVQPAPFASQIATLQQIRNEVAKLGRVAPYEAVRRIRQAWDQVAKVKYLPSSATDALKSQGDAIAAVKGTGAIREALSATDQGTAAANAQYTVAKAANDVLDATAEIERVRPKVGRQLMARLTGVLGGQHAGGIPGAIAGYVLAPAADSALSAGFTMRLQTARLLTKLAAAIRSGNAASVESVAAKLKRLGAQGAELQGRSTSPSEPQMPPEPASQRP